LPASKEYAPASILSMTSTMSHMVMWRDGSLPALALTATGRLPKVLPVIE
jgi:hypothetical protein